MYKNMLHFTMHTYHFVYIYIYVRFDKRIKQRLEEMNDSIDVVLILVPSSSAKELMITLK